ncbi:MAG TPA: efflux RND transporter permease subunit, partial [Candidatus Anammoximicrobium sp.]|nr:efflux RND transporter permease subunit [Candidatus Anammoximicrobium sp.]
MMLSEFSVRRPVATSCLMIGLTLLGINAYRKMGLELMPKLDIPYITVVTVYPGASPEELEADVAKRIEDAVVSIDGLKHVSSTCMENVCQTLLEFQLHVDVDIAATDVREKLDLIRADLPDQVEDPIIQKFDINAKPIVTLALAGDVPLDELYDFADNTLRDRLTVISGVADVQLVGGAERRVQVELDRNRLAARGLFSLNVVQAIQQAVRTVPSGRVRDGTTEYSVKFDAEYDRFADLADLEIANELGQRCHIRDVGQVAMATEEVRQAARLDGRPCIAIKVVKKADANAVRVAEAVREAMTVLNAELPGGMELVWIEDDGTFIEASNQSAWSNVFQGILLTAAILFVFLYNLRSLLVVVVTMPLTIVVGLFFMQMVGYTLNTSTLIAIGMSTGILVTNSIVVLEAIVDRLDACGDPREAARLGAKEAFIAVVASASTNVVVLFPHLHDVEPDAPRAHAEGCRRHPRLRQPPQGVELGRAVRVQPGVPLGTQ